MADRRGEEAHRRRFWRQRRPGGDPLARERHQVGTSGDAAMAAAARTTPARGRDPRRDRHTGGTGLAATTAAASWGGNVGRQRGGHTRYERRDGALCAQVDGNNTPPPVRVAGGRGKRDPPLCCVSVDTRWAQNWVRPWSCAYKQNPTKIQKALHMNTQSIAHASLQPGDVFTAAGSCVRGPGHSSAVVARSHVSRKGPRSPPATRGYEVASGGGESWEGGADSAFLPPCRHVGTAMRLSHPPNPFINVGDMIATGCCGRRPPAAPARLHPPAARGACSAA